MQYAMRGGGLAAVPRLSALLYMPSNQPQWPLSACTDAPTIAPCMGASKWCAKPQQYWASLPSAPYVTIRLQHHCRPTFRDNEQQRLNTAQKGTIRYEPDGPGPDKIPASTLAAGCSVLQLVGYSRAGRLRLTGLHCMNANETNSCMHNTPLYKAS